jgi:hypothetical protein
MTNARLLFLQCIIASGWHNASLFSLPIGNSRVNHLKLGQFSAYTLTLMGFENVNGVYLAIINRVLFPLRSGGSKADDRVAGRICIFNLLPVCNR